VGSFGDWLDTTFGLVLTIGGLAATAAFFAGLLGIPPNLKRLNELGAQVEAAGGTPEDFAEAIRRDSAKWLDVDQAVWHQARLSRK